MRSFVVCLVVASSVSRVSAQENGAALPSRLQALARNESFRLTRVLGTPEVQASYFGVFSADGKQAIFIEDLSTYGEKTPQLHARILIWEVGHPAWPREIDIPGKAIAGLDLSADAKTALVTGHVAGAKEKQARPYVSLWDLAAGKEVKSLPIKDPELYQGWLSPDGTIALIASSGRLMEWHPSTGQVNELTKFGKEQAGVASLAFLPGGKQFLITSDRGIELWDIGKTKRVRTYVDPKKGRTAFGFAIAKDTTRFVTAHDMDLLILWDTQSGQPLKEIRLKDVKGNEAIAGFVFADDGKILLASISQIGHFFPGAPHPTTRLFAWDTESNKIHWSKPSFYFGGVPIRVQGDRLLVGGGPNYLDVLSIKDGKLLERHGAHKGPVHAIGINKTGDLLSAGSEGALITWRDGKLTNRTMPHAGSITALAFNKDRTQWLSAGNDPVIRSWPPNATRTATFTKKNTGPITSLAFASAGNWAASGSGDRTVRTWFVKTGEEIQVFEGHSEGVNAVAISPDGRWLASGSDDATIKLWPVKDGKLDPDREPITLEKHTKPVTCLMFTLDGKRLLSGSQDQKLMVWNWQKGSMDFMISGHKNWITSIVMLDAKTVLTASDDLTIAAWNLEDGMELGRIDFGIVGDCPRCIAQTGPDRFVVGSSSWLIYEFQMTPGKTKAGKKTSSR